jgi:hypothetical protein
VPHYYPQKWIFIFIPQYSTINKAKSPLKSAIATYVHDFSTKMSSISEQMSASTPCAACSFFQLCLSVEEGIPPVRACFSLVLG